MRDILKRILEEKNFSIKDISFDKEETFRANRIEDFGFDFLTVLFIDKENFSKTTLTEYIEILFNTISQQDDLEMGWDKNLSLLIMLKVNNINISSETQSLIFDLEEDPFLFKKYILPYTESQENLFNNQFEAFEGDGILNFLNHILYDSENFSIFKTKKNTEEYLLYDLVSKLFIKLPYLNIVNQNKEIKTLINVIVDGFTEEEQEVWTELIKLKGNEGDDPDIQKILEAIGVTDNE